MHRSSREEILDRIAQNGGGQEFSPPFVRPTLYPDAVLKFKEVLTSIGGSVIRVHSDRGIEEYISHHFDADLRIISVIPLADHKGMSRSNTLHPLDNVEITLITAHFGVAENGAVWITDDQLSDRVLPFICQHLMVILDVKKIIPTMHEAYDRIGRSDYNFGTFIAGPSKTADIEQSLVLGAHGPKTMTVFLLEDNTNG